MFKIGQKVIVLFDANGVKKDDIITVIDIVTCMCGETYVNYGVKHDLAKENSMCPCCYKSLKSNGYWWRHSSGFAPIIENTSTSDIAQQIFSQHFELQEVKIPEYIEN